MSATRTVPVSRRRMVTPEGVNLQTELADIGLRIGAFTLDLFIIVISILGMAFALGMGFFWSGAESWAGELAGVILVIFSFFMQFFYFVVMEAGRRGATLGKRWLKIRVASRTSPRLSASSVLVRNAMRQLEFFLPLSVFFGIGGDVDGIIALATFVWVAVFLFFPLFNKDRLRAGDLLAGTWVVRAPKPQLLPDLSETRAVGDFAFTPAQVEAYGIKELHVLEDVMRGFDRNLQRDVAERIRIKIGWSRGANESDRAFLDAYYRALRERLESRLVFGVRKADKFDAE